MADHKRRIAVSRDRAAGALVAVVRSVDDAEVPLLVRSRAAWACPAADGFEEQVRSHGVRLDGVVRDLRSAANRLMADADRLRSEARALEAQADALDVEATVPGPL